MDRHPEVPRDPRRNAPKAVLSSVIGAFIIGGVFLLGTLMAIPNMHKAITGLWGPAQIIDANFSNAFPHLRAPIAARRTRVFLSNLVQ